VQEVTYIEIAEFRFCLKEKLINEQFRIHVKQSSLHRNEKRQTEKKKRQENIHKNENSRGRAKGNNQFLIQPPVQC
jgi:hypothetical protein